MSCIDIKVKVLSQDAGISITPMDTANIKAIAYEMPLLKTESVEHLGISVKEAVSTKPRFFFTQVPLCGLRWQNYVHWQS